MKLELTLFDCPFCGNRAQHSVEDNIERSLILHIDCVACPAKMTTYLAYGSKESPDMKKVNELVTAWNSRVYTY